MARTELPNGITLPAEYSDDWYDDMTSNLTKLDDVIGSDAEKLSETDVGAAALSNDYTDLDNKPDLSPYDQHLANTDIHVTTADKQKWNDNVSQSYVLRYASTSVTPSSTIAYSVLNNTDNIKAGDSVIDSAGQVFLIASVDSVNETVTVSAVLLTLALDANVMHLTGNETAGGIKTFSNYIPVDGTYLGNESSSNERTNICLRSNRDTADQSGAYISRFRSNKNQGGLLGSDNSFISISFLENGIRYTRCFDLGLTDWDTDGIPQTCYLTSPGGKGVLGTSSRKWQTMNGVEPSSLSFPSGNTSDRLDISSYITAFDGSSNSYTPPVNGWISISANNSTEVYVFLNNLYGAKNSRPTAGSIIVTLPVLKGIAVAIRITDGSLGYARFIPCQGNV